jgi:hypothetical protein
MNPPLPLSISLVETPDSFFYNLLVCADLSPVSLSTSVCVSVVLVSFVWVSTYFTLGSSEFSPLIFLLDVSVSFGVGSYTSPLGRTFLG